MIMRHMKNFLRWLCPSLMGLYTVRHVTDEPQELSTRIIYVVGERDNEWLASFCCPCGCGAHVRLNLLDCEGRPKWNVHEDTRKRASLRPSVSRNVGCKSHFWVSKGDVQWC
jgi:hypothetical protein